LWVFGNNIEDSMGHIRFLCFYLVIGAVAAAVQIALAPASSVPMVGASGAMMGRVSHVSIHHFPGLPPLEGPRGCGYVSGQFAASSRETPHAFHL